MGVIASTDQYKAAATHRPSWFKSTARTTVAAVPFTMFDVAGGPGAGTLAGASTTAGVVPTSATAGFPSIPSGWSALNVYLTKLIFRNTVASAIDVYDCLFKAGAYAYNANVTLSGQPSFSARCPDYSGGATWGVGNEIWIEAVTAFTGNQTITVTYTNQDGVTGRTTGAIATGVAPIVGRMLRLPLQAGDTGVQKIESVVSSVSTVGTFNVLVLRPLEMSFRVNAPNDREKRGFLDLSVLISQATAVYPIITADSTSSGLPSLFIEFSAA